ncbi:GNAT family N-acetyltransferase [Deinococcus oregonensis]|uniref:GNAT family N-acetyltransferase n=1 Tax=Deinococcus oregonensis TaxID=1805970 RepID=A0ABV6B3E2_9DEIO
MSRALLRPLIAADAPALCAYRNDPTVARYQGWNLPYTLADAEALIAQMQGRTLGQDGWTQIAFADAVSGELLGDFAVRGLGQQAELGVTLAPQSQGRGLASAGLRLVLQQIFGSLRLHRVYASIDPRNQAAAALLLRAGFRHEGTTRQSYWHRGEWTDDATYGLLHSEWQVLPEKQP